MEGQRSPSIVAGNLVLIVLMLFATAEAAELMGFDVVRKLMSEFLVFGGRVIMGLIILGVGMYLAGLANEIINLAFGMTAGAIAVAIALAFGLGAEWREQLNSVREKQN